MTQGATLDSIFGTPAPAASASAPATSKGAQTLSGIFSAPNTSAPATATAAKNSPLASIFTDAPKVSTPPTLEQEGGKAISSGLKTFADYSNNILKGTSDPLEEAMKNVDKNVKESVDGKKNPLSAGVDVAGNIAKGVVGMFGGAVNASVLKPLSDLLSKTPGIDTVASSKYSVVPAVLDQMDATSKALADKWNTFAQSHPAVAEKVADAGNIGQFMLLFAGDNPKAQKAAQTVADSIKSGIDAGTDGINKSVETAKNAVVDTSKQAKDATTKYIQKKVPSENIDTTVGKVIQGKASDVPSVKRALSTRVTDPAGNVISEPLDTSKVKTYKDLYTASDAKIKEVARTQDTILSKDTAVHPADTLEKTVGEGKNAVKTNYVTEAIDNLKELYTGTNDAANLSKIKALEEKANGEGLTKQEINNLARDYGSEFKSKAFGKKNGEALTGINAQRFENTRTGLKDTARDLLPDETSKALDKQMTDLYKVKELSGKMAQKVNAAVQRLQSKNIFQKIGSQIGKFGKVTGIGDIVKELTGLQNTPGASSMSAVEIESKLAKNLGRITKALGQDDAGFISTIRDIVNHPK